MVDEWCVGSEEGVTLVGGQVLLVGLPHQIRLGRRFGRPRSRPWGNDPSYSYFVRLPLFRLASVFRALRFRRWSVPPLDTGFL